MFCILHVNIPLKIKIPWGEMRICTKNILSLEVYPQLPRSLKINCLINTSLQNKF